MVLSLAAAIWFAFSDAQWSYYWGAELDTDNSPVKRAESRVKKLLWHWQKSTAERAMLGSFVVAAVSGAAFVFARTS